MKRLLIREINLCEECPHSKFDPDYGDSKQKNMGYDCMFSGMPKRIYNQTDVMRLREGKEIPIPDWCPLPTNRND